MRVRISIKYASSQGYHMAVITDEDTVTVTGSSVVIEQSNPDKTITFTGDIAEFVTVVSHLQPGELMY